MAPLFEIFVKTGVWFGILAALAWIAYARLATTPDQAERWVKALSEPWLLKAAIFLGLLSWVWSFGLLLWGDVYLRGAGSFTELSTVLLFVILALAGAAWWRHRPGTRFHPWITLGIVLMLILSPGGLLLDAPKGNLSQETPREEDAVRFVRGRLEHLGCYDAVDEPSDGESFDALTASAVTSFQAANGLAKDPKTNYPGEIRRKELRLLARPFPFLLGPNPCPAP
jgi:hypothetical protein